MTGNEHRLHAEEMLAQYRERRRQVSDPKNVFIALALDMGEALVHAVLALTPDQVTHQ